MRVVLETRICACYLKWDQKGSPVGTVPSDCVICLILWIIFLENAVNIKNHFLKNGVLTAPGNYSLDFL